MMHRVNPKSQNILNPNTLLSLGLIVVCKDIETSQVLIMTGKIEIKVKMYKVFGWIRRDIHRFNRAEYQFALGNKNAHDLLKQKQKQTQNESECKKSYGLDVVCWQMSIIIIHFLIKMS